MMDGYDIDWWLLSGLLLCVLLIGGWIFWWRGFSYRMKDEFRAHQPALCITNISTLNNGDVITLTMDLENIGEGVAYDCILQLSGWDGNFTTSTIHPPGDRYQRYSIPIVLRADSPIRVKPLSRASLRLACSDSWGFRYECWYPIIQEQNIATSLYNVEVDLSEPEVVEPQFSPWTMWKLLRKISADD